MNEVKNYVELPRDEHGNRAYTPSRPIVIKAEAEPGKGKKGTWGSLARLYVIEPLDIKARWPTLSEAGWKEVNYSVGVITEEKWKELVGIEV